MDHWGDPWADDAEPKTMTVKREEPEVRKEVAPAPVASAGPVLFGSFLDDAQWGADGEEEGFGGWGGAPVQGDDGRAEETRVAVREQTSFEESALEVVRDDGLHAKSAFDIGNEGWGSIEDEEDTPRHYEQVVSEASDSATTMQPDDAIERTSQDLEHISHRDDDLSTRPSTSPSDASHTGPLSESPRTSIEEERTLARELEVLPEAAGGKTTQAVADTEDEVETSKVPSEDGEEMDDEFGDFEEDSLDTIEEEIPSLAVTEAPLEEASSSIHKDMNSEFVPPKPLPLAALATDLVLINELFSPSKNTEEPPEAPDNPIFTTSARKAWYQLTRKQTLREYNSGSDENSYIRVTWANSNIRTDVGKIIGKWAHEDRISGRGQAARASFYWDSKPVPEARAPITHTRKKSSISVSNPIRPIKPKVQPLATTLPTAQFNWSSEPLASPDPWQQNSPTVRAVSSPITPKHIAVTKLQKPQSRASSLDLARQDSSQTPHRSSMESVPKLISPTANGSKADNQGFGDAGSVGTSQPSSAIERSDSWATLGALDTTPPPPVVNSAVNDDDDDDNEWGEMVESPAMSSPMSIPGPPPTMPIKPPPPQPTTPLKHSSQSSPSASASRDAAQIVRLKGTVSPTSAVFRFNSFVPASTEDGPIGPGLLKPAALFRENTPEKARIEYPAEAPDEKKPTRPPLTTSITDNFTAFESSLPSPDPEPVAISHTPIITSPTIPSPITAEHVSDTQVHSVPENPLPTSLFDVDFSIFESAPLAPAQQQPVLDPSDPFSLFDTPAPVFKREVPGAVTLPPKLPLTGASNSAQRRKEEEDEILRGIVEGFPDLGAYRLVEQLKILWQDSFFDSLVGYIRRRTLEFKLAFYCQQVKKETIGDRQALQRTFQEHYVRVLKNTIAEFDQFAQMIDKAIEEIQADVATESWALFETVKTPSVDKDIPNTCLLFRSKMYHERLTSALQEPEMRPLQWGIGLLHEKYQLHSHLKFLLEIRDELEPPGGGTAQGPLPSFCH
ncbi:hypothetical protein P154DRAFT_567546 [Amniculicola lignicola CBS 123094]|uniref:Uncharacterized protein n=1 Tax=Amniculicola lignicola CBS 123094 TaxID=1392246 RepID=A0A6A5VYY5_9PLEO|nr:hypothetical protein P154DRAFT_567546 [Amniculicola lignicola CBS 123094]